MKSILENGNFVILRDGSKYTYDSENNIFYNDNEWTSLTLYDEDLNSVLLPRLDVVSLYDCDGTLISERII